MPTPTAKDAGVNDISFERCGVAGVITLNRPQALNAVSREMVRALSRQLDAWENDPNISRVVISAIGSRAVSAGIATHRIRSQDVSTLLDGLTPATSVDACMDALAGTAGEGALGSRRDAIGRLFRGERVEDILAALDAEAAGDGMDAAFAN